MPRFLRELQALGVCGVQNFPTVGLIDGTFREHLEQTGMAYAREVDMVREARALGLLTTPYVFAPADLKGVFVRKFRWGTVDVLSPEHCDFAALRTAVLSTHMKMLKIRTKEVLYEKYRTEKLLARRATRNISEDETRKLLEDLGL
ncbi:hypothetical protein NUW54_g8556 [Trametes sanguinea]|uniref:Uncharacterized protein n=1 Tax=Trametes sanguinea TaxID=158606 RepID=A0ACC1PDW6_9APHY|nr:hypothetical protein NUW54_g8556 [Trametes sanguinea]